MLGYGKQSFALALLLDPESCTHCMDHPDYSQEYRRIQRASKKLADKVREDPDLRARVKEALRKDYDATCKRWRPLKTRRW